MTPLNDFLVLPQPTLKLTAAFFYILTPVLSTCSLLHFCLEIPLRTKFETESKKGKGPKPNQPRLSSPLKTEEQKDVLKIKTTKQIKV